MVKFQSEKPGSELQVLKDDFNRGERALEERIKLVSIVGAIYSVAKIALAIILSLVWTQGD